MARNPLGAVIVGDNGVPQTWTVRAGGNISGGDFLQVISGAPAVPPVGSAASSFVTSDVTVAAAGSGRNVVGLAMHNAASGTATYVTMAHKGKFIVTAGGAVDPATNANVTADGSEAVQATTTAGMQIGKAWTNAGSEQYLVLNLDI